MVAWIETRGRRTGVTVPVAAGFVEEADGSLLVSAGQPDADWALNLEADPRATVMIEGATTAMTAERLVGPEVSHAIVELILKYGTPAERLGRGPTFRLRPVGESTDR